MLSLNELDALVSLHEGQSEFVLRVEANSLTLISLVTILLLVYSALETSHPQL